MGRSLFAIAKYASLSLALVCAANDGVMAQRGGGQAGGRGQGTSGSGAQPDTTTGFAINDQLTIQNCARCHRRDSTGYMQRISYSRKTPEGWEMSVRRMVSLNNVKLDAPTARSIVRYLSDHQGLAPAELRPGRFEVERRLIEYRYTADARTETTCRACHSMGRVITQRRTRSEWELLVATHRSLYPDVDFQAFRRNGPPPDSAPGAPHPMDAAIAHLSVAHARVGGLVGHDADAAPRGIVGAGGERARARCLLWTVDHCPRASRRRVRHASQLPVRQWWSGREAERPRDCLYWFPMAWTFH